MSSLRKSRLGTFAVSAIRRTFHSVGLEVNRRKAIDTLLKRHSENETLIPQLQAKIAADAQALESARAKIAADAQALAELGELRNIAAEYQLKLERKPDYQVIMAQDQIRAGTINLEPEFMHFYDQCREYTMTSWERMYALYKAILYIIENRISGDIVECGVWRGGSMRLVAMVLLSRKQTDRTLYLYDTFEGMAEPDMRDVDLYGNKAADDWYQIKRRGVKWAYAPLEEVRETMTATGYPMERVVFVKGPVETTIPGTVPERIALLRLDTDWYSSTKQSIEHLYRRLSPNGVLALDDYGHYQGAQQAIDEYFDRFGARPFLNRIDYSCRFGVKPHTE